MFATPQTDIGVGATQTVIADYARRANTYEEVVEPSRELEPLTVIGGVLFDSSAWRAPTKIAGRLESAAAQSALHIDFNSVDEVISRLYEYLALSENWDGYGGRAPDTRTIFDAETFLRALGEGSATAPRPMVAGDGEVGFYWKWPGGYAEATFNGNGTFTYFAKSGEKTIFAENISLGMAEALNDLRFALAA